MLTIGEFINWYAKGWIVHGLTADTVTLRLDGTQKTFDFPRQVFVAYEPDRVTA